MRRRDAQTVTLRAVARTLIGGGCIFIYTGSARLTSFEINFISKETSLARPEYMNIHPPINALATALVTLSLCRGGTQHVVINIFNL